MCWGNRSSFTAFVANVHQDDPGNMLGEMFSLDAKNPGPLASPRRHNIEPVCLPPQAESHMSAKVGGPTSLHNFGIVLI